MRKWQLILRYARRRGWVLVWAFPLAITSGVLTVLQPWPLKVVVDNVLGAAPLPPPLEQTLRALSISTERMDLLMVAAIAMLALFAANRLVGTLLTWISIQGTWRTVYHLAENVFDRLQRRSLLFHRKNAVGELMSRVLSDPRCAQDLLEHMLFTPIVALVTTAGMLALMLRIDVLLTLLAFAAAPFSWGITALVSDRLRVAARQNRQIEGEIQSQLQQAFAGIGVIQAFAREEHEESRFRGLAERHIKSQKTNLLLGRINGLGTGLISAVTTGLVLWLISRNVLGGQISLGSAVLFLTYFGTLQTQLGVMRNVSNVARVVGENAGRIAQVLDTPAEITDQPNARALPEIRGEVEFKGVTAGYDGLPVLKNVSLRVEPGTTVAIVGPTGSGKTTLANLIPRFADPWEGSVRIDGHELREIELQSLRRQVAVLLQESFLSAVSVAENIGYGNPEATRAEIESAARAACAHDFIAALPQGYDTVIGERGLTLSGGMRQRIAIARAFLKNAPILILDEPSSALDAETEKRIFDALSTHARRRTTFVIAHRLSTIREADLIVVLKDGQIVESGRHAELRARGGHYARMQDAHETLTHPGPWS